MSFSLRALLSHLPCFGSGSSNNNSSSNNNNNKDPASPLTISGPKCFTHEGTGNPEFPMRPFVSTPPPYVQPARP
ncbi:hypothetical protein M436DRAFT_81870 [Aureobasidium namibiae CBS 147.97]|uniref:Uncharacterized protein n=1 Tax=Aureobasidium namibiae CBS 147.97 TaxID=1043004 RepID=A0A074WPF8_9PEZI